TDAQLAELELKTGHQRMDSTQIGSNIRRYTRLQLLVETMQRAARMLNEEDQTQYADLLAPYVQGTAGQYCYRIKNDDLNDHL
ncbi:MAG: DDE transposase, partial [Anaerolineae bacterium]|nr:DDE transposase [Anaerolineae bacterium]